MKVQVDHTHTIANICQVAADQYAQNAAELRKVTEDTWFMTVAAAQKLAEQFDLQERDARRFAHLFSGAEAFSFQTNWED